MALDLNDKTTNGNNLTNNGGATEETSSLPFGASTSAANLASASSQYFSAVDSASLSLSTTGTIELWAYFTTLPADGSIMELVAKSDGTLGIGYHFYLENNSAVYSLKISADDSVGNRDLYKVTVTPSTSTWYHYAVTIDTTQASATTYEFFVNGVSQGNGIAVTANNIATINDNARALLIGSLEANNVKGNFWNGKVDEVRVWNVVRTAGQISGNYQSELNGNESGLVAYWPFEASIGSGVVSRFTGYSFVI